MQLQGPDTDCGTVSRYTIPHRPGIVDKSQAYVYNTNPIGVDNKCVGLPWSFWYEGGLLVAARLQYGCKLHNIRACCVYLNDMYVISGTVLLGCVCHPPSVHVTHGCLLSRRQSSRSRKLYMARHLSSSDGAEVCTINSVHAGRTSDCRYCACMSCICPGLACGLPLAA